MRRLLPATLLVLTVPWFSLNCGDNDANEDEGGGSAGRAQGGDAPSSGGRANSGGTAGEGGNGGEGNAPSSGGQTSSGGAGGEGGSSNSCAESTNCCELEDPTCEEGWESVCSQSGNWNETHYCCDAPRGIRQSCNFSGDIMTRIDEVCLDCDGKSFGINACDDCFEGRDECHERTVPTPMICDDEQGDTTCKNSEAGYVIDCSARPDRVVQCVCNPDAIVVTTE